METRLGVAALAAAILVTFPALADVPPPEVEACWNADVGDPCDGGICRNGTCTRGANGQAGATIEYECIKCVEGTGSGGAGAGDVGVAGTSNAGTGDQGGTPQVGKGCACRLPGDHGEERFGGWLWGGGVILLLALSRRRPRGPASRELEQ